MKIFAFIVAFLSATIIYAEPLTRENANALFGIHTKLKTEKGDDKKVSPITRPNELRVNYEQRGDYDLITVKNTSFEKSINWTGRVYESGANCLCQAPRNCIVGPTCNKPLEDIRAYAGRHECVPNLEIEPSDEVASCP